MELGPCKNCGGPTMINPKNGNVFCKAKCWTLNKTNNAQPAGQLTYTQTPTYVKKEATDWKEISLGKCRHGFLIEAYKLGKTLEVAKVEAEAWAKASMGE